jgi:hypothetical protein
MCLPQHRLPFFPYCSLLEMHVLGNFMPVQTLLQYPVPTRTCFTCARCCFFSAIKDIRLWRLRGVFLSFSSTAPFPATACPINATDDYSFTVPECGLFQPAVNDYDVMLPSPVTARTRINAQLDCKGPQMCGPGGNDFDLLLFENSPDDAYAHHVCTLWTDALRKVATSGRPIIVDSYLKILPFPFFV